jgi:hypothetical protein
MVININIQLYFHESHIVRQRIKDLSCGGYQVPKSSSSRVNQGSRMAGDQLKTERVAWASAKIKILISGARALH